MGDLVSLLHFKQLYQFVVTSLSCFVNCKSHRIDAASLKTAVLDHQATQEIAEIRDDSVLEVQHGIFADLATPALEYAPEHFDVSGFIGTLAGDRHSQVPVG